MALTDFYKDVIFLNKISQSDGLGGIEFVYIEGVKFKGVITRESNTQIRIAEQEGLKAVYTLSTSKSIQIDFGDLIKYEGKVYKVVSNKNELQTPHFSNLDLQQYIVEKYEV